MGFQVNRSEWTPALGFLCVDFGQITQFSWVSFCPMWKSGYLRRQCDVSFHNHFTQCLPHSAQQILIFLGYKPNL